MYISHGHQFISYIFRDISLQVMAHFVKVAKKLFDLNNLHSTKAIVSALQSVAIFRMTKTWMNISKRDRTTFERITDVFSEAHNFKVW